MTEVNDHKSQSHWAQSFARFRRDKLGLASFAVVMIYFIIAILVQLEIVGSGWDDFVDPMGFSPPSKEYWFGTNFNGQDVFTRAIYSTKVAFQVGITVSFISVFIGAIIGSAAGYFSGSALDEFILWLNGCIDAIPYLLFVAAISFILPDSNTSMYIALIATGWVATCKYMRAQAIQYKNYVFVEAARAMGSYDLRIILRHILPNTAPLILIEITINFVGAIKAEAMLSFLGIGIKNGISWGIMLAEATSEIIAGHTNNFLSASLFMFVLVIAFNMFSDALQDALDPNFQK
ncbi:MAG: ABC transporter permease [Zetaproteobacteria bacterium]|nr:ABC transporter permease [Zetaproteobacteria bacterium]